MSSRIPAAPRPLHIERTAWFLLRRFGGAALDVASRRARFCHNDNRPHSAREWNSVGLKIREYQAGLAAGRMH